MNRAASGIATASTWLWLGGNLAVGLIVPPIAFGLLKNQLGDEAGREHAGLVVGSILAVWSTLAFIILVALGAGALWLAILNWRQERKLRASIWAVGLLLLTALHSTGHLIIARAQAMNQERASESANSENAERDRTFRGLHRLSTSIFGTETLVLLVLGVTACLPRMQAQLPAVSTEEELEDA